MLMLLGYNQLAGTSALLRLPSPPAAAGLTAALQLRSLPCKASTAMLGARHAAAAC